MEKLVRYRIEKISQPTYVIQDKGEFAIHGEDCDITMDLGFRVLRTEQQLHINLRARYFDKRNGEALCDFNVDVYFGVQDFENVFSFEEAKVNIPDTLLLDAMSVTIGTARGMIVLKSAGTYLSEIFLPIYNVIDLLNRLKGQETPAISS